jgi:hypothetical protein
MMKNRYGNEYSFVKKGDNEYSIVSGDLDHWRFGGREGVEMDMNNLGFVDPSGGPFISIGYEINGRKVTNIASNSEGIFFTVEAEND